MDRHFESLDETVTQFGWLIGEVGSYGGANRLHPDAEATAERRFAAHFLLRAIDVGCALSIELADRLADEHGVPFIGRDGPEPSRVRLHASQWRGELHRAVSTLSGMGDDERHVYLQAITELVRSLMTRARSRQARECVGGGDQPSGTGWPVNPTDGGEESVAAPRRRKIPQEETNVLVREYLREHAPKSSTGIRRDDIAAATGASTGAVSKAPAWIAYIERRDAEANPEVRTVPLTDDMLAVVQGDSEMPEELAALMEEQEADEAEQARRHDRQG